MDESTQSETDFSIEGTLKKTVIDTLISDPQARKDLADYVKKNTGYPASPYVEKLFGDIPNKKRNIEEIDIPARDVADNIFYLLDEGYNIPQIAHQLRLWPRTVRQFIKDREKWDKEIKKNTTIEMPWYFKFIPLFNKFTNIFLKR